MAKSSASTQYREVISVMTKRIPNFEYYEKELSKITQKGELWCIPANVLSVTKYFVPDSPVTQEYILKRCDRGLTFSEVQAKVLEVDPNYSWCQSRRIVKDIDTLAYSIIPSEIGKGPVIISLPAEEPSPDFHVYTAVECDNHGGLLLHDTGAGKLISKNLDYMKTALQKRKQTETDVLIIRPK
jgi:hypothetical protein